LLERKILSEKGDIINVSKEGPVAFFCHLFWPLIDSYWVAAVSLYSLQPNLAIKRKVLVQRIQWISEKMHNEDKLAFYESCSMEVLGNAVDLFQSWKVLNFKYGTTSDSNAEVSRNKKKRVVRPEPEDPLVSLLPPYHKESVLLALISRINEARKASYQTHSQDLPLKRALLSDFPVLAKM